MKRRTALGTLAAGLVSPAWAAFRDVLDTPAAPSAFAARGLLNGLARAAQRIVAVGQRGHVLTSDDAGKTWQQAEVPVSCDLVAVHFATPQLGWAVGHDGVVLHSADAGRRWTRQFDGRSLGDKGAENPLLDVWFDAGGRNGIAVGAFGSVLRTVDGGKAWANAADSVDNPKGMHLYAIKRVAGALHIAGEQGLLLRHDGARFVPVATPYPGTFFGIAGNERAVLAHGLRGNVVRSTDSGRSWTAVPTGVGVGLTASTVDERGRFVIASQAGHVLLSSDDGASFAPLKLERPLPAAAVISAGAGALVVAGPRGVQTLPLN
jgi:photosystem II stability/assembly factor-like uncharacterized protein